MASSIPGKAAGEARVVLERLELRLGEWIVVGHLGAAERADHPEIGQQLRGALARHRCAAVGVQGQHLGLNALFVAGLLDEPTGQSGVLPIGEHPATT